MVMLPFHGVGAGSDAVSLVNTFIDTYSEDDPDATVVDQAGAGNQASALVEYSNGDESEITISTSITQGKTSYLSIQQPRRRREDQPEHGERASRPQIEPIETLAGRLLERIDEVRGVQDPLAVLSLPLTTSEGVDLALYGEEYSRYQGETFPMKGESDADQAGLQRHLYGFGWNGHSSRDLYRLLAGPRWPERRRSFPPGHHA